MNHVLRQLTAVALIAVAALAITAAQPRLSPAPADNATGVSVQTTLSWDPVPQATSYSIRLATAPDQIATTAYFATGIEATGPRAKQAFRRDPRLVWEWYRSRRARITSSHPNAAHEAVVRLAFASERFLLVTQNVDDLHARASYQGQHLQPDRTVQIHGDIFVSRCERGDFHRRHPDEDGEGVPECPTCGARLRPGVVWFDEELDTAQVDRIEAFIREGPCDLVLVIGTTATFDYIRHWIVAAAGSTGRIVEVNPEETALSPLAHESVRERAAVAVPALVDAFVN